LVVDDKYWKSTSHIESYDSQGVTAVIDPEYPSTDSNEVKLYVGLIEFPRGDIVGEDVTSEFDRSDGQKRFNIDVVDGQLSTNKDYHYLAGLLPSSADADNVSYSDITSFM
jgi:hypothetical protein